MKWRTRLDELIDQQADDLVALRRHLHAHPEPSGEESQTSVHLYRLFDERGLQVKIGPNGCGVIVDSRHQEASPRLALRADIDALRIQEEKQSSYRSQAPGVMHACGHDAHTTCSVGALVALDQLAQEGLLPCRFAWRGIFQPSEETATGAAQMIEAGAADGVDAFFALHVDPNFKAGEIGVRSGVMTANAEMMRITIHGTGGHAARPHESHDPIAAAAELINTLYQFVPRRTDSRQAVVVTIGRIAGGDTPNAIPEKVELLGTVRTLDRQVQLRTWEHIHRLAHGVAEITGTKIEVECLVSIPAVENSAELTELVRVEAMDLLGQSAVRLIDSPSMGSEDYALYGQHAPATMFRLGAVTHPPGPPLHNPMFDIDESCLTIGAKLLARSAIAWAESNADNA